MGFRFARAVACLLGVGVAAFGCSGADQSGEADESTNAQSSAASPAPWGASYVSQSFPLATGALKMKAGQVIPSYIELKNIGTSTWDSNTRIGTTEPRDRTSVFADSTWVNASRPSAVTGTVAPGGTFKFTFDLKAPTKLGTYEEFFGVVEDGAVWFGDPGQGGPVDNDLEVMVEVSAADPIDDAGAIDDDSGADSGAPISVSQIPEDGDGGSGEHDPSATDPTTSDGKGGGCNVSSTNGSRNGHFYGANAIGAFVMLGLALLGRRRRVDRISRFYPE
ncbi:MAG: NBR1-Ig-like domain-containing protein [Polyangiaceae bacterium]